MNRIVLGTAQFGMDYGINNTHGKIRPEEVFNILDEAARMGIDTLDTANSYGNSEKVIGDFIQDSNVTFKLVSKVPECKPDKISMLFDKSLSRLRVPEIYGYLFHCFDAYRKDEKAWSELEVLRSSGRVKKIGFSLYYPYELECLLKKGLDIDIIQIPFSVFDQRFTSYLSDMHKRGIEVYARSLFLQGLVFKDPKDLGPYFSRIRYKIDDLRSLSYRLNVSILSLCVNFATANRFIDKVVVGVDSLENLVEIIEASKDKLIGKDIISTILNLSIDDENILLPFRWDLSKGCHDK